MSFLLPAFTGTPGQDRVYHTDLFTLCAALPDASVDMILCDLPYGATACEWDTRIPLEPMWAAFKRVIKPRGAIVLTASQPFTSMLVMSWLDGLKEELIWEKQHPKGFLDARRKHMDAHETVLVFGSGQLAYRPQGTRPVIIKNGRKNKQGRGVYGIVNNPGYVQYEGNFPRTVLRFDALTHDSFHPTQKPVALFEYLIRTYTQPGDTVLDPCVGSGTTAIAARKTGRHFIVGDTSAEYVEVARHRLAGTLEVHKAKQAGQPYTLPMFAEAIQS